MSHVVMKFGGASVSGDDRLRRVARVIVAAGADPVVVVSAQQGRTDQLIGEMRALAPRRRPRPWTSSSRWASSTLPPCSRPP